MVGFEQMFNGDDTGNAKYSVLEMTVAQYQWKCLTGCRAAVWLRIRKTRSFAANDTAFSFHNESLLRSSLVISAP